MKNYFGKKIYRLDLLSNTKRKREGKMFSNIDKNYEMIFGAYKKIKSYYYYNKNYIFMRQKISEFEYNHEHLKKVFGMLADLLMNPIKYEEMINGWIESISYYVVPKTFKDEKNNSNEQFISSVVQSNKKICKVNFFINMPIELYILETVWTLYIGKQVYDKGIISQSCYGNVVDNNIVYNSNTEIEDSINFKKNKLFKVYFEQYCKWKNGAIDAVDRIRQNDNILLLSLDIKGYYYSVIWQFSFLKTILDLDFLKEIEALTDIIEKIFCRYTMIIKNVRILNQNIEDKEYILPIGMFCSMLLANIYLAYYDKSISELSNIAYYGRYVDDMLIVINLKDKRFTCDALELNNILTKELSILDDLGENYCIHEFSNLLIQKEKLKVIYFKQGESDSLFYKLKNTVIIPSQMNVIPSNELDLEDFEEEAYAMKNFSSETKIREIGKLEINRLKLGRHIAQLVRFGKNGVNQLSEQDKRKRWQEERKIISFFTGSNALEFNSNWINVLYFLMLIENEKPSNWYRFQENVKNAIDSLEIEKLEAIPEESILDVQVLMKKQLKAQFDICVATVLAVNPAFEKKENTSITELALKIRNSNMYNHYLVNYPLLNYIDNIDDNQDLVHICIEDLKEKKLDLMSANKIEFSPRFIAIEELFQFELIRCIATKEAVNITQEKINTIYDQFYKLNYINTTYTKNVQLKLRYQIYKDLHDNEYCIQRFSLQGKKVNLNKVGIAVANIKLNLEDCFLGLREAEVVRNRSDFIKILSEVYEEKKTIQKVNFLVFPEFYLPFEWITDVLNFVKKTGIVVVTGIQYICRDEDAHNTIGVFAQVRAGKYKNAIMFIREKNNYAPLEKEILALKGHCCIDQKTPVYSIYNYNGISFGTFLCYEFTDSVARSLYKDEVDIIFAPEDNKDTNYFSNIIDTMTRDLHTFVVQSNNSVYGDSRISGPYGKNLNNIIQIKGGENDSVIIGEIDIKGLRESRVIERNKEEKTLEKYRYEFSQTDKKNELWKIQEKGKRTIKHTSARTFY